MDFDIPRAEFIFEALVECGAPQQIGRTPAGNSSMVPILGGTVDGPQIKGRVLGGGADWPLQRHDKVQTIEANYAIQTHDGIIIRINNRGMVMMDEESIARIAQSQGAPPPKLNVRTVIAFVAPEGPYDWLNKAVFVGTLDIDRGAQGAVIVRAFKLV